MHAQFTTVLFIPLSDLKSGRDPRISRWKSYNSAKPQNKKTNVQREKCKFLIHWFRHTSYIFICFTLQNFNFLSTFHYIGLNVRTLRFLMSSIHLGSKLYYTHFHTVQELENYTHIHTVQELENYTIYIFIQCKN